MNRFLGGACVLVFALCTGVTAFAGDFKGFYVGGNVGGANGNSIGAQTSTIFSPTGYFATTSVPAIATTGSQKLGPGGFTGGGQAGYNIQHLWFVLGFEVDYGVMNMTDKKSGTTKYPCCNANFTVTQFAGTSWLFTARPRIGFTGGPLLVYGTGGLAVTNYEYTALFTDTFATAREGFRTENNQNGWAAGAGVEFKRGKHWGWKGEYLRASFSGGASTHTSTNLTTSIAPFAFPSNVFTHSVGDLGGANIYRFGFNYHF